MKRSLGVRGNVWLSRREHYVEREGPVVEGKCLYERKRFVGRKTARWQRRLRCQEKSLIVIGKDRLLGRTIKSEKIGRQGRR